jgi:Xaa-Pro aminopeptidase
MVNFRYLTHIGSKHGGFAICPIEGNPVVFSAPPHINTPFSPYLSLQEWVQDIRPFTVLAKVVKTMSELGYERARVGVAGYGSALVMYSVTYRDYVRLMELMPKAVFTDVTPMAEEMRLIKSAEEIGMLEKAGKIVRKAIDAMIDMAKPGVKECELYVEMVRTQIADGAEALIFLLLTAGQIDCDEDGVKHLLHAQIEYMRPGVTLRELWEAARAPVEKAGLYFLEFVFHGHGMVSPEFPVVVYKPGRGLISGDHICNMLLKEGMVFGNNIDIYDPCWKIDVGHMLGDCLVIEADRARRLVDVSEELVEVNA